MSLWYFVDGEEQKTVDKMLKQIDSLTVKTDIAS